MRPSCRRNGPVLAAMLVSAVVFGACTSPPADDRSRIPDLALETADAVYLCRVVITGGNIHYIVQEVWRETGDPNRRVLPGDEVQPDPRRLTRPGASYGEQCLVIESAPTTPVSSGPTAPYAAFSVSNGALRINGRALDEVYASFLKRSDGSEKS